MGEGGGGEKAGGGGKAGSCNNVNINNFLNKKQQGKNSIFLNGEMQYIEVWNVLSLQAHVYLQLIKAASIVPGLLPYVVLLLNRPFSNCLFLEYTL